MATDVQKKTLKMSAAVESDVANTVDLDSMDNEALRQRAFEGVFQEWTLVQVG